MQHKHLILTIVFCTVLCITVYGRIWQDQQVVQQTSSVQKVEEFDVQPYIKQVQQAKSVCIKATEAAKDNAQTLKNATEQYNNKENDIFNNMANARRAQYEAVRFTVTRNCHGETATNSKSFTSHKYQEGDIRISNPNPNEFVMVPGSGQVINVRIKEHHGNGARYENIRQEGQDFIVHLWMRGPCYCNQNSFIDVTLVSQYRYNEATITKLVDADMPALKEKVEEAIK